MTNGLIAGESGDAEALRAPTTRERLGPQRRVLSGDGRSSEGIQRTRWQASRPLPRLPCQCARKSHPRKVRERTPDSNYRAEKSTRRLFPKGSVAFRITVWSTPSLLKLWRRWFGIIGPATFENY